MEFFIVSCIYLLFWLLCNLSWVLLFYFELGNLLWKRIVLNCFLFRVMICIVKFCEFLFLFSRCFWYLFCVWKLRLWVRLILLVNNMIGDKVIKVDSRRELIGRCCDMCWYFVFVRWELRCEVVGGVVVGVIVVYVFCCWSIWII